MARKRRKGGKGAARLVKIIDCLNDGYLPPPLDYPFLPLTGKKGGKSLPWLRQSLAATRNAVLTNGVRQLL
ncbi:MAG TPA: hypothetical protein PK619_00095 [bacterium]|nr:hypothetical protein [bacterium]HNZ73725.1 hypothetical protein [bacterium]HOH67646.1 hypothetical protein [bacterium]HPN81400.1 hypothetical protein [bacterium]HPW39112.1 hypothetical protein [bacterium]